MVELQLKVSDANVFGIRGYRLGMVELQLGLLTTGWSVSDGYRLGMVELQRFGAIMGRKAYYKLPLGHG